MPYCCNRYIFDEDLEEHYEDDHYYCGLCGRLFNSEHALHQHNKANHHYCEPCRRVFLSSSNLNAHLNSKLHKPRNFPCPMRGCTGTFISPAAVVLHLEAGTCKSGITRAQIDRYVVENDRNNVITNPRRMITGGSSQYTPPPTNIATNASWNGHAFECYFCHREFSKLYGLNAHLASPRHTSPEQKIYRCPNRECGNTMSTMSGLCQHVESGSCGVKKFSGVQETMDQFIGGMKRLTL